MIQIEQIDTSAGADVQRFINFHYDLYKGCPQWVPPFRSDIKLMLNKKKHPFYEHSDADFFVARQNGKIVGRVAILENRHFNEYHGTHQGSFYLFDTINDMEVGRALFDRASEWAAKRKLNRIVGPKGFNVFDGYGIQVEGFEHRQMMTMMNYNFPYYSEIMDQLGFEKEVDFVSCYMSREQFDLPEKYQEISRRVEERGTFQIKRFNTKKELTQWAWRIGQAYNDTFVNNWEYYPLTKREVKMLLDSILVIANPKLIKLILHKDKIIGFLLGFPDISAALQRQGGNITPWGILDFLRELKRTSWISLNGVGVLPEYHGRGANALLYTEMVRSVREYGFDHLELTQMAETAVQVRREFENVGADPYKNHRVYHKEL